MSLIANCAHKQRAGGVFRVVQRGASQSGLASLAEFAQGIKRQAGANAAKAVAFNRAGLR